MEPLRQQKLCTALFRLGTRLLLDRGKWHFRTWDARIFFHLLVCGDKVELSDHSFSPQASFRGWWGTSLWSRGSQTLRYLLHFSLLTLLFEGLGLVNKP